MSLYTIINIHYFNQQILLVLQLRYLYICTPDTVYNLYEFSTGYFDQLEVNKFVEESLKMSRFKHTHVMGLIGVCLDAGSAPYIVMPYMANGSLLQYLKKERNNLVFPEDTEESEVNTFIGNYTHLN